MWIFKFIAILSNAQWFNFEAKYFNGIGKKFLESEFFDALIFLPFLRCYCRLGKKEFKISQSLRNIYGHRAIKNSRKKTEDKLGQKFLPNLNSIKILFQKQVQIKFTFNPTLLWDYFKFLNKVGIKYQFYFGWIKFISFNIDFLHGIQMEAFFRAEYGHRKRFWSDKFRTYFHLLLIFPDDYH